MCSKTFLYLLIFSSLFGSLIEIHNPLLEEQLVLVRDPQTSPKNFRKSLNTIGQVLGYECAKDFQTKEISIKTSLNDTATHNIPSEKPVLVTILRGGLPIMEGVSKMFPDSLQGFLGMARDEKTLLPKLTYIALPDVKDKTVLLIDTMIATAGSCKDALGLLQKRGAKKIIILGVFAAKIGIENLQKDFPDVSIFIATIDPILNQKGYIVPGLGDAGDRSYGEKID